MKTKIKRHSRSVLSVVLALCMLVSCMTAGMIMTDAAKVDSGTVGGSDNTITDYYFKGSFDGWTNHYVNGSGEASININTAGTYEFVVVTGGGTQRRADHTFTSSGSYNTSQNQSNFKIQVTTTGTYTFKTSTMNSGGSVTVTLTFPSGGSSTSTDWRLVDGGCNWTHASSNKKFTLNSSTGLYEYSQYFAGNNYFRISDGTSQYNGNGGSSDVTLTAGADFVDLGSAATNKSFAFSPSTAGTYIVQVDATNKKIRIQSAQKYNITCNTASGGSISASPTSASAGENVIITVTPNSGYALKSLVLNYDDADHDVSSRVSGNSYTFEMPAFNVTATPTFTNSKTIYFNNYEAKWSKVYVYTKNTNGDEGNGAAPGMEMTQVGTSSIYSAEIPSDTTYIVFSGSGGATNEGSTHITYKTNNNYGNALPSDYNEYKATAADGTTGEWTTHSNRNNVYTVTPGTSITGNTGLYYKGITATLYDYYTDGEYNNGSAKWITGIQPYDANNRKAEYSVDDGKKFKWNPYKTFNAALSSYATDNSVPYPLYFGNLNIRDSGKGNSEGYLEYVGGEGSNVYTNWADKISNSVRLKPNGTSVTGLASATENNSTIAHSNGAAMMMFDEDWLSQENSTGNPLATILHSSAFPVRKITKAGGYNVTKVYLSPGVWDSGNAWFVACFRNNNDSSTDTFVKMETDSTGYFGASIPSGYENAQIHFIRKDPDNSSLDWSGKWNEINDLTMPTDDKVLFTISGWGSGQGTGSWGNNSNIDVPQYDSYTYYEYDSTNGTDNAYIQNVKTGDHTATMEYSTTEKAYSADAGSGSTAGFYPFDNMKASDGDHTSDINNVHLNTDRPHDLGFGMKLEIPFSLNPNGTVDSTANGIAQTFNFSGDDDLWVYIDGHLVLDLGGAHKKAEGSIDFKNKTATSTTKVAAASDVGPSTNGNDYTATATYSNDFSDWFDAGSETLHTMTIYYMERGMFESNLKFDFSFHAISNLYTTEKKVRTGGARFTGINSGFYVQTSETIDDATGLTKFEASYQNESFDVDHKVSSDNTTYDYPANGFNYAKVEITPTRTGESKTTSTATYTVEDGLIYNLTNDDRAQFNGKFTTGDYFQLTETPMATNKYQYKPTLRVFDDTDSTGKTLLPVTNLGNNSFSFRFAEPDPNGLKTVNVRGQLENEMKHHDLKITKSIGDKTDTNTEFVFRITFNFEYESGTDNGYEGYPLYISSDKDSSKTQLDGIHIGGASAVSFGYFKLKAGETITIPKIPEGADFKIEEILNGISGYADPITDYTFGNMSVIGATATAVSGENAVTMTMGATDVNLTATNNDNTVKATIRVKYAPSYYDFENYTSEVKQDTYKNGTKFTNHIDCSTEFTDSAKDSTVIGEYTMVETAVRDASATFDVEVGSYNAGGYLFIGWYDENGNRYNNTDETQHDTTAKAPKDQDRIFEARFIKPPTYRIDFEVPTRLWGKRIYKVFGKVTLSMISEKYIGYVSTGETTAAVEKRYYLTRKFVHDNIPHESIFLQTVDWPEIDEGITSTEYKVSKTVTTNTAPITNVEVTATGENVYDLYRKIEATTDDQMVKVQIFSDCDHPDTAQVIETVPYGSPINNYATVATNIPTGKTFYRWKIETLDSLGEAISNTEDGTLVTYDYSKNFNYVAYDNYKVTVEYIDKKGDKDYNPYSAQNDNDPYHAYAPTNTSSVIVLGQTRSHWNDTETGVAYQPKQGDSTKHLNANNDVDRLILDLGLSYSENEIKLNTEDDLQVGFIIEYQKNDGTWQQWKEVNFSSKLLGEKNRIEYYYDLKNAEANRSVKFKVTPTIRGVKNGTSAEFDFKSPKFSAQT